jgi:hypothetical protein
VDWTEVAQDRYEWRALGNRVTNLRILCLIKHHVMNAFTPRPLYPEKRNPGIHWIGGCVGPKSGVDAVVKRKIQALAGNRSLIVQPLA